MANNPNDPKTSSSGSSEEEELPATEPMTNPPRAAIPPGSGANLLDDPLLGNIPTAEPASGIPRAVHDPEAAVGNLDPVSAVSPASGWLDSDIPLPSVGRAVDEPLAVEQADLFEAPPLVESSDIFSTGSAPPAKSIEGSDVINATAYGEVKPANRDPSARPSDVALTFDLPPGGSTIASATGSGDLPVAEEVVDPLFDSARHAALAANDDAPDYGSVPEMTQDASSILADLSDPGDITIEDSSAIRLEAPGVGRTLSSQPSSGTEFDLTVGEGEIPPELADAAAAAESGVPPARSRRKKSDPEERTTPELDVDEGRVYPIDLRLRPEDPSSIFDSINDPVVFRKPGQTTPSAEDEEAAVEFTDHPDDDELSGSSSSLFGAESRRGRSPRPASEHDFELPAEPASGDSGVLDWTPAADDESRQEGGTSSILRRGGKLSKPQTEPSDPEAATHAAPPLASPSREKTSPARPLAGGSPSEDEATREGVDLDWVAGSSAEQPPVEAPLIERTPAPRKTKVKDKERPNRPPSTAKRGSGWIGGALVGMLVTGVAFAGMYFGNLIPNSPKPTTQAQTPNPNPPGGNPDGTNPGVLLPPAALPGQARVFAKIQELGKVNTTVASMDDADLKKAREELQAVVDDAEAAKTAGGERKAVEATIYLGVTHELSGDRAAARKVYESAIQKFPKYRASFQAALDRLDAMSGRADGVSRRFTPIEAEHLLLALVLLQDDPAKEDPEAGTFFWKAVKSAGEGNYTDAIQLIGQAKAVHAKQAKAAPGRGLNPLSDPLDQIFTRSCDDLKAYWELRAAIYSNKAVADLVKKDGAAKALAELERRAGTAVKLMADLKVARDQVMKANSDLKDASVKVTKAETDLKSSRELVLKLEKDVKAADDTRIATEKLLKDEASARTAADAARKKGDDLVASLAKELQNAKLLPEKYDVAALVAAQKAATARATGPTLTALLPAGMMAVGGGLSAGQLTDIAERLTRAEAVAKAADTKLATETKKLRDDHAADVKKLTDGYASETKTLMDTYATSTTRLKDDHAGEVKKMADKFVSDSKKLTETFETKVKDLEVAVTKEKAAAEALTAKFRVDLGNAMSPAQSLDVWLPLLTDLRRPADADPALATAAKVLSTSPGDSEDAAKARTVAGLAYFVKGEMAKAKAMFVSAKASPAFRAASGKPWAAAAEIGLLSIDDPLAPYRRPVEALKRDTKAAARFLDTGVKAYKSGRYVDAAAALAESVKADDRDPVAWYYLGAARWESAGRERADDAFKQGAEREKVWPLPARMIGDALGPIQGAARDALTAARP